MNDNTIKESQTQISYEEFIGKEELVIQILTKFDLLLNKEEYYNHQERVYKLNKAYCSINKAIDLNVSNFIETPEGSENINKPTLDLSLESLSLLLDELLKEKESNTLDKDYLSMLTSSSEEDSKISACKVTPNRRRKGLFKNLYNYELILKTFLYENNMVETRLKEEDSQMFENLTNKSTPTNLKTLNPRKSLLYEDPILIGTPSNSKISKDQDSSAKSSNLTPMLKKSFFEDSDIKNCFNNRRRSHVEQIKTHGQFNISLNTSKRKSCMENLTSQYANSHSNTKPINAMMEELEVKENSEMVSQFNWPSTKDDKRGSIFRDQNHLTNIVENEEYATNLSMEVEFSQEN